MAVTFLLAAGALWAEALQPGRIYSGPMKLSAPDLGASMRLPPEWEAQIPSPRGPLVLQARGNLLRILIEGNAAAVTAPEALLPERLDYYGLRLVSSAQITAMRTSLLYRLYRVEGSGEFSRALLYAVGGPQGRAVVLYGFFNPGGYETMRRTMLSLADSIGFTPMRALPKQMSGLFQRIAGGHFVFYDRRGSYSEKREVWLCRGGDALLKGVQTARNEMARVTVSRRGTWRLEDGNLLLEFAEGSPERYRVTVKGNTLYFNEAQTYRLPNHTCE